jgi:hypothetical protein
MARSAPTTVTVVLTRDGRTFRIARVVSPQCDVRLVEVLLRIALEARRQGWAMRIEGVEDDLRDLFGFLGLGELLAYGSALEAGGQPEGREQLDVEEVVDPRDAAP